MRTLPKVGRLLIAVIVVLAWARPALAQDDGVGFGVKGGYLYSSLSFSNTSNLYSGKSGWMAGFFIGGGHSSTVGAQIELNYLNKGATDASTGANTTLHYLDIPVLLRINIGSRSHNGVSVYIIAGPGFDFKVGESISSIAQVQNFNTFDFNIIAGGGIEITRLILEARGMWGLSNIAVNTLSAGNLHSRSFALLAGIRLN